MKSENENLKADIENLKNEEIFKKNEFLTQQNTILEENNCLKEVVDNITEQIKVLESKSSEYESEKINRLVYQIEIYKDDCKRFMNKIVRELSRSVDKIN